MKEALKRHKSLLKSNTRLPEDDLKKLIHRFKRASNQSLHKNSFSYLLNLHTLGYEFVSDQCVAFTGLTSAEFCEKGLDVLPEIMVSEDLAKLAKHIFPEMETAYKAMEPEDRSKIMFEIYYRLKGHDNKEPISIVEYSSYTVFDEEGNATASTGICYESSLQINGVRGIVRLQTDSGQELIYDHMILHELEVLTATELKLTELLSKGNTRKDIAQEMNVSIHTVKTHVKNIYKKLNVNSATELISHLNPN
ncbi:response regulator transcription factor [Nonlabens sp. YIK11]|uniref:response regulator transcription factor n=1 Tax=Nonlabens sp. YIK11 TaxID=1453349 RepID=UPI0006DC558E|nr:helix-turn-helix transcriptional regulator [Nonlabens sp. YIK11]